MIRSIRFLLFINLALAACSLCGQSGDSLREQRLHYEYLLFSTTDSLLQNELNMKIAGIYNQTSDYDHALEQLHDIDTARMADSAKSRYAYLAGHTLFLSDEFRRSLNKFEQVDFPLLSNDEQLNLRSMQVISLNELWSLDSAQVLLEQTLLTFQKDTSGVSEAYRKAKNVKQYSVRKALVLSRVFPGAGLFYVQEPGKAVSSMTTSLLFAGYAALSVVQGHYITATLTGLSQFIRFYGGGSKATVRNASSKNKALQDTEISTLNRVCVNKLLMH